MTRVVFQKGSERSTFTGKNAEAGGVKRWLIEGTEIKPTHFGSSAPVFIGVASVWEICKEAGEGGCSACRLPVTGGGPWPLAAVPHQKGPEKGVGRNFS